MIEVEPFELLHLLSGISYASLQVVVPVWLCVRFHVRGALISVPFLWGLRLAWLLALPAVDPQADTNFSAAAWFILGIPTCVIIASLIFGLSSIARAIMRKVGWASSHSPGSRLHRLEVWGLPFVTVAILLIGGLTLIGKGGNSGPMYKSLGIIGKPWKFYAWIENASPDTMHNVVAICEVVDGNKVIERYSFHRDTLCPGEEWDVEAPIRNDDMLARIGSNNAKYTYRSRITAERKRVGPFLFVYRRKWDT